MTSKISLTVNAQRHRADKLLHIEHQLLQLMEVKLSNNACNQMVDLLSETMEVRPTRLEWQQHIALSTAMCRTLLSFGKDVPETLVNGRIPELLFSLKKVRKTARDTKRQCMALFNCTMDTHNDFKQALFQYKNVLESFNVYLFSLADKRTCREIALKHHRMVAKQTDAAKYAQQWTLGEFIMFTNIRHLVNDEIMKLCSKDQSKAELDKEDEYIARIHNEFLKLPEAWHWTLLADIQCTDAFFGSDWLLRFYGITQKCAVALRKKDLQTIGSEEYHQLKALKPPESHAIAHAYNHSGDREAVTSETTILAGGLSFDTVTPSDCETEIFVRDTDMTNFTTPPVVVTQMSEDSPITYFQKPLQSISHSTVKVEHLSPTHDDYGSDVEVLDEQPSQGLVVIEDFDSTQALIECLQTPGIIVKPPVIPMVTQSVGPAKPIHTQCITVLSSQEVDTSSMSSDPKSSDVPLQNLPSVESILLPTPSKPAGLPVLVSQRIGTESTCPKPPQEIAVVLPMSPAVELSGLMNKQPSKAVVVIDNDDTAQAHTGCMQTSSLIVKPSIPKDTRSDEPATPIVLSSQEVDTSLQNLQSMQQKVLNTPAGFPVSVSTKQPNQTAVVSLISPIAKERPSRVTTTLNVERKRCAAKQSQLDRTKVPRHTFLPLTFGQTTKPAITGAAISMSALVPNENDPIESDSSSNANSWYYETQPMIFGMNKKHTTQRENKQLEPAVQEADVNGQIQTEQQQQLQTEQQPTGQVSVQPSIQTVQQQPTDQVSVAEKKQSGCAASENEVWNAVADPNSLAAKLRKMLKCGRFEFQNRSTQLNFEMALVSGKPEIVLNAEMFYLLMNVTPAERPLLFDIVNATSPNFKYGDVNLSNELLCLLLMAADPANGFNLQDRCKNVRDIHIYVATLKQIRDNMVARM